MSKLAIIGNTARGQVPAEWCDARRLGTCTAQGSYADIYSAYWVGRLHQTLASECLKLGLEISTSLFSNMENHAD